MQHHIPLTIWLLAGALAGCHQPFHVVTNSRVVLGAPEQADAKPLVPMKVTGGSCNGCRVALIDVDGLLVNANLTGLNSIGENPVAVFREKLEHVAKSPCYCAVVLRINSPGGGVTASDIMRRELVKFRNQTGKPVVACLMDLGAGGAYYLATAADCIVAHPTTITGGMGVILNLYNLQDTMAQMNIEGVPIKAGQFTDLGTPIKTIKPAGREILQEVADEFHGRMVDTVRNARGLTLPDDAELFDGRIYTAPSALELQLVDSIGYLDDALEMARCAAGCPSAAAVVLHRPQDPARSAYDITPNTPVQANLIPFSLPGLDRSRLPTFLYLWQPEPTMEKLGGI